MAKVVFLMDTEEGHIIPSFGLANSLKKNGHQVVYFSIVDNREVVLEQGFDFYPILEEIYFKGYKKKLKDIVRLKGTGDGIKDLEKEYVDHIGHLINGSYDELLREVAADLYVMSTFLHSDTLILHYKYHITPVIFTPFLREPGRTPASECLDYFNNVPPEEIMKVMDAFSEELGDLTSLHQLVKPMDSFCEIVVCPRELDISQDALRENVHYIGPSIRNEDFAANASVFDGISPDKKIIFASLGSQASKYGETGFLFFTKLVRIMKAEELRDCHLILALGNDYLIENLEEAPKNVTICKWAPQISVLKRASLAIIHGGLGSIKECIYFGVPMILFPMGYDQPLNAKRVAYHGLGLRGDIGEISEAGLKRYVLHVKDDSGIRANIDRMQRIFVEMEQANPGLAIIEGILSARKDRAAASLISPS